ncbi:MAG: site-specific integrase [Gemmataceae bacterium]|nr:site-specific integrase [Gemmataceae bacterium]
MAWLEQHPTSGHYHLCFRWNGARKRRSLATADGKAAEAIRLRFEENVALLERGRLDLPPAADIMTFLLSDGKLAASPKAAPAPPVRTLGEVAGRYLAALGNGSVEANSLETVRMHLNHVRRKLGDGFALKDLTAADLQDYLDTRVRRKGKKAVPLSPVTLRKEIASFRACFNWAVHTGLLAGPFPNRGLRFPKGEDKRPFMTWEDIERRVGRGGLAAAETKRLWDCLFLDLRQIDEFLAFVKGHASRPWVYPMCVAAAHTGARRSELARLQIDDIDFQGKTVLVHERKRVRGQRTTRRVPLTPFLEQALRDWLAAGHPGGRVVFAQKEKHGHQPQEGEPAIPITVDDAGWHFVETVKGSKWAVLRGWHVLRHSFASNLAAKGVDQRFIDEFLGHQTEAQRRRYRHLFPHQQRQVLCGVFGG